MKEHPLLLKGEMIRAVLKDGKTQTRRPIVPQPELKLNWSAPGKDGLTFFNKLGEETCTTALDSLQMYLNNEPELYHCPWQVGDRLWVREAFAISDGFRSAIPEFFESHIKGSPWLIWYLANGPKPRVYTKTIPSIHMPRWASRITLEIMDIRVERIQEISTADSFVEGWPGIEVCQAGSLAWFRKIWDSIYAKKGYGWNENPWVWVREFRKKDE